jgi:prepilin-type N-terminal cleavage/methylation domain-containing protein
MARRSQISYSNRAARLRAADGFTLIELMIAMFVLIVGIVGTFRVFESSNRAASVSEVQQDEIHRAQREIERLEALPYSQLFLTKAPATSLSKTNPGFYVSGGSCPGSPPTFRWSQPAGQADPLIIDGCTYKLGESGKEKEETLNAGEYKENVNKECTGFKGVAACGEGVAPSTPWKDERANGVSGTIYDYITWVTDPHCNTEHEGCPAANDYKRITVELTNNTTNSAIVPTTPVLVTAIVVNPKALPAKKPKSENPLESAEVKCTNGLGQQVPCNYGLGTQTAHSFYLTNWPEETSSTYKAATSNACMHYTDALKPLTCAGVAEAAKCSLVATLYTSCPQLDLLNVTEPQEPESEPFFSENLESPFESTRGRIILRDPKATNCSVDPENDARYAEWWATAPLAEGLKLSGNGALTLYTRALKELSAPVTLCVGVYLENPVADSTCKAVLGPAGKAILDPLNLLNSTCATTKERKDSEKLGVVSFTKEQWPSTEATPVSFTFNYMASAKQVAAGSSLAARIWVTKGSGEDIVALYDAAHLPSLVQLNSE